MPSFIAVVLALALVAGSCAPAGAGGGHAEQAPHSVVAEVREVDRLQKRLVLSDGVEVWVTDARQLDQLSEGTKVRIRIEMSGGRRMAYSIERLPR